MSNLAIRKRVLEDSVKNPAIVTDGITTGYTSNAGFAYFPFPGTLTVDLENRSAIKCIRFLLWDNLGKGGTTPNSRRYRYRLAVSNDNSHWNELYTTPDEGTIGWQLFTFKSGIHARYVRIYGLHNTAKPHIHIVELEAHDDCPEKPTGYIGTDTELPGDTEKSIISDESFTTATRVDSIALNKIIVTLEQSPIDKDLVRSIKARFEDLVVLDQNLDAIRREIVNPVTGEIRKSNRLAVIALTITIIALILNIIFSVVG